MKAAVALEDYKLPVFRKRLTEAGYEYQDAGPLTGDCTVLHVETDDLRALAELLAKCQVECAQHKG